MSFKILTTDELITYTKNFKWTRKFSEYQIHHCWKPDHSNFNGTNGIALQEAMRNYHVNNLGWQTIGQHLTLLPDGKFITGRDFNIIPASISGRNSLCFLAIEMIGNFDTGYDKLEGEQLNSILKLVNWGINYYNLGTKGIVFHNEYASKSCPGTGIDKKWFVDKVINYKENNQKEIDEDMSILNTKNTIKFNYNDIPQNIDNYIINDTSYVKTRDIINLFSKILNYNTNSRTVNIVDNIVKIDVDGKIINGQLINDTTFCPVRILAESLGKEVDYNETEKKVYIK